MNYRFYFYSYVMWAVISFLVYRNANQRGLKNAFFWAMLTLFFGILGLLGYYFRIIRPNKQG